LSYLKTWIVWYWLINWKWLGFFGDSDMFGYWLAEDDCLMSVIGKWDYMNHYQLGVVDLTKQSCFF
jgi:hypothetical protein